jgi:hypothetical protein
LHFPWVKNYFLYIILTRNSDLILEELEEFQNFINTFQEFLGPELEDYIEIFEALLDIVEDLFF